MSDIATAVSSREMELKCVQGRNQSRSEFPIETYRKVANSDIHVEQVHMDVIQKVFLLCFRQHVRDY